MKTNSKKKKLKDQLLHVDLSEIIGNGWEEIQISEAGLTLPGWHRPFSPDELRSTFMRLQLICMLEQQNHRLRIERGQAWQAQERAEDSAEYYRQQLAFKSFLRASVHGLV